MGSDYYTSRGLEPYVNPATGRIDVRAPAAPGSDQYAAGPSTPEQNAQIAYARSHTKGQVQARQQAEQSKRNAIMGISTAEQASIDAANRAAQINRARITADNVVGVWIPDAVNPQNVRAPFSPTPAGVMAQKAQPMGTPMTPRMKENAILTGMDLRGGTPATMPIVEAGAGASRAINDLLQTKNYPPGLRGAAESFIGMATTYPAGMVGGIESTMRGWNDPTYGLNVGLKTKHLVEDTYSYATNDPINFAGSTIGPALVLGGAGRGMGAIRTVKAEYIPIEKIGTDAPYGYPKLPGTPRAGTMTKAFTENRFIPAPKEMSVSGRNLPAELPTNARLPGDTPGTVMWTGWEKSPGSILTKGETRAQLVIGKGSSEIPGMYGAPAAEGYFTKAGTSPEIGFSTPTIRSPSIIHTTVEGFTPVPKGMRSTPGAMRFSEGTPAGRAVLPLYKAEYEAVLPMGNVVELAGKPRFYTRLGGFGKNHLLGTRVPIYEMKAIGKKISTETKGENIVKGSYASELRSKPIINLAYPVASLGTPRSSRSRSRASSNATPGSMISKMLSETDRVTNSTRRSRITQKNSDYSGISRSSIASSLSGSGKRSIATPPRSPPSYKPDSYTGPRYTPPYTPGYTPERLTPPYTPPWTPRGSGGTIPPIPGAGSGPGGAGRRGGIWGRWSGKNWLNKVVGFKEFFGTKTRTKRRKKK